METGKRLLDVLAGRAPSIAGSLGLALSTVMIAVDWGTWVELDVSIVYSLPLVVAALARSRRLLWGLTSCLVFAAFTVYLLKIPSGAFALYEPFFINRVLSVVTIIMTAAVLHVWMLAVNAIAAHSQSLAEQNRELVHLREFAEAVSNRKTQLLAAVSHDIGTPLTVIDMVSQFILKTAEKPELSEKIPEMVQRLQRNTHSLMALRSALVDIASLDARQTPLHNSEFSLNDLLLEEHQRLLPLAQAKNLRFMVEAATEPVRLFTDRDKLSRVLTNLITNAVKYTEQGSVGVSMVRSAQGSMMIRVSDTGIGMAAGDLQRIFDEYGQLGNPERNSNKGWGLGLAICRRLMMAMGGNISVESERNRGTTFTLDLPASCVVNAVPNTLHEEPDAAAPEQVR